MPSCHLNSDFGSFRFLKTTLHFGAVSHNSSIACLIGIHLSVLPKVSAFFAAAVIGPISVAFRVYLNFPSAKER